MHYMLIKNAINLIVTALILLTPNIALSESPENVKIDFGSPKEANNWVIVNDTVMGGRSAAQIAVTDDKLFFFGLLSLENNGGFASVRRVGDPKNWQSEHPLMVTLKGDGRAYQFRVRTSNGFNSVAYVANFKTSDKEQTLRFETSDFIPQWRGRRITNAPRLDFADIRQIGVMLADKTPGTFTLALTTISQVSE